MIDANDSGACERMAHIGIVGREYAPCASMHPADGSGNGIIGCGRGGQSRACVAYVLDEIYKLLHAHEHRLQ
ncbi:hypothetical protein [Mesorhizobium sp. M0276]|uniref:hypothetical protein n=1 Tax=Mesorhizobium sp. M0276 TaxID=2956928 RepID=UPI0033361CB7